MKMASRRPDRRNFEATVTTLTVAGTLVSLGLLYLAPMSPLTRNLGAGKIFHRGFRPRGLHSLNPLSQYSDPKNIQIHSPTFSAGDDYDESLRYTRPMFLDQTGVAKKVQKLQSMESESSTILFTCSHTDMTLAKDLFPQYTTYLPIEEVTRLNLPTTKALQLAPTGQGCVPPSAQFLGKTLYVNGEWHGDTRGENAYEIGYLPDSERSTQVFYVAILLNFYAGRPWLGFVENIFDPNKRVKNNGKYFLLYVTSNCVEYRENAFDELSKIGIVHQGGICSGLGLAKKTNQLETAPNALKCKREEQSSCNFKLLHDYRFSLVMESTAVEGYITEKILNAFLAGTVPIWYGTREVFQIFNKDAFIFYDVEDPQPALELVACLEKNKTAYDHMLAQPILVNGERTIEDYFSLRDDIGGGKLKNRIRSMMGLTVL